MSRCLKMLLSESSDLKKLTEMENRKSKRTDEEGLSKVKDGLEEMKLHGKYRKTKYLDVLLIVLSMICYVKDHIKGQYLPFRFFKTVV